MLQNAERQESETTDIDDDHQRVRAVGPERPVATVVPDDGLLRVAGPMLVALYAIALSVCVMTFKGSGEALFAVVIAIGFATMFFTIPILMMRVRARHDARWRPSGPQDATDRIQTFTGSLKRWEAVLQVVIVPAAAALAFASFGLIWTFATH